MDANPRAFACACAHPSACVPGVNSGGLGCRRRCLGAGTVTERRAANRWGYDPRMEPFYPERLRRRATGPPRLTYQEIPLLLSVGPALHWARPLPHPPPFIGYRSRPSSISLSPLAPLPRYPLREFPHWRRPHPLICHQTPPSVWVPPLAILHSFCISCWLLETWE